ncbi:MAG: YncE family protein [Anaerolineae bacterium]
MWKRNELILGLACLMGLGLLGCQLIARLVSTATPVPVTTVPVATPLIVQEASPTPTPLKAPAVVGLIPLYPLLDQGRSPVAVEVMKGRAYVANSGSDNLSIIEEEQVVAVIPVGQKPAAVAADPERERIYVANRGDKTVSVVEGEEVVREIAVDGEPNTVLVTGDRVYVGLYGDQNLMVLDGDSGAVLRSLSLDTPSGILALAADPIAGRLYAAAYNQTFILDIETLSVQNVVRLNSYQTLVADPRLGLVFTNEYVAETNARYLVAIDGGSGAIVGRAPIGADAMGAAVDGEAGLIYVTNSWSNSVTVVKVGREEANPLPTLEVLATIPVGLRPVAVAVDETSGQVYVANNESHNVMVIHAQSHEVIAVVPLAIAPAGMAVDEEVGRLYVANPSTDSLFVVEGQELIGEVRAGHHPLAVAVNPALKRTYVANYASGDLSLIGLDSLTLSATVPITRQLSALDVDPLKGRLYADNHVLDEQTLETIGIFELEGYTLGSRSRAEAIKVNPLTGQIYAVGWNGIPGSNSGQIIYVVDGQTLNQAGAFGERNITAWAFDREANRLYASATHPLALSTQLVAIEGLTNEVAFRLDLTARVAGMAFNMNTHHLFLSHPEDIPGSPEAAALGDTVTVLDVRTFGQIANIPVGPDPGAVAVVGDLVYVANRGDGTLTVIRDVAMPAPPPPTPTVTPTPYPTLPPLPTLTPTPFPLPTSTPTQILPSPTPTTPCAVLPVRGFGKLWQENAGVRQELGCALELELPGGPVTQQPFQAGHLYWHQETNTTYILFADGTWQSFRGSIDSVLSDRPGLSTKLGSTLGDRRDFTGTIERFQQGLMLWSPTKWAGTTWADQKVIYVLNYGPDQAGGTWQRFDDLFEG